MTFFFIALSLATLLLIAGVVADYHINKKGPQI